MESTRCRLCDQRGNKNCCVWRLYYRKYKNLDWSSSDFEDFQNQIQKQIVREVEENEAEELPEYYLRKIRKSDIEYGDDVPVPLFGEVFVLN